MQIYHLVLFPESCQFIERYILSTEREKRKKKTPHEKFNFVIPNWNEIENLPLWIQENKIVFFPIRKIESTWIFSPTRQNVRCLMLQRVLNRSSLRFFFLSFLYFSSFSFGFLLLLTWYCVYDTRTCLSALHVDVYPILHGFRTKNEKITNNKKNQKLYVIVLQCNVRMNVYLFNAFASTTKHLSFAHKINFDSLG